MRACLAPICRRGISPQSNFDGFAPIEAALTETGVISLPDPAGNSPDGAGAVKVVNNVATRLDTFFQGNRGRVGGVNLNLPAYACMCLSVCLSVCLCVAQSAAARQKLHGPATLYSFSCLNLRYVRHTRGVPPFSATIPFDSLLLGYNTVAQCGGNCVAMTGTRMTLTGSGAMAAGDTRVTTWGRLGGWVLMSLLADPFLLDPLGQCFFATRRRNSFSTAPPVSLVVVVVVVIRRIGALERDTPRQTMIFGPNGGG